MIAILIIGAIASYIAYQETHSKVLTFGWIAVTVATAFSM